MIIVLIIILYVIFITHNHIKLNIIVVDEDVDYIIYLSYNYFMK
jgi:hypothetical protein